MLEIAIVEDNSIKRTTIVDLITGLKKGELTGELEDPVSFLAGVFLYVIKYTKNPKKVELLSLLWNIWNKLRLDMYLLQILREKEVQIITMCNMNIDSTKQ